MRTYKLLLLLPVLLLAGCEKNVPVSSVTVIPSSISSMEVGEVRYLTATVKPDKATDKSVDWKSSNEYVVTVTYDGMVTAVGPGNATVTAEAVNGGKTGTCDITVIPSQDPQPPEIKATSVTLNESELVLAKNDTFVLTAALEPSDTTDELKWSSSDTSVATVDNAGKVTAIAGGHAVITATAGDVSAQASVSVEVPVKSFYVPQKSITLPLGMTYDAYVEYTPADATPHDVKVEWSIRYSSPIVFQLSKEGKITATAIGANVCDAVITYAEYDFSTRAYVQKQDECALEIVVVKQEDGDHEGFDNENWD